MRPPSLTPPADVPHGTHFCSLADGRRLAYCQYGDAGGFPVLYCHGWPGSRLGARLLSKDCADAGIRLIAPDRPGIGLSDPLPRRTILDWARDVQELTGALGIESFGVLGVSGGMPYVLATCVSLPAAVVGAAVLSGMGQFDSAGALDGMPAHMRTIYATGQRSPRFTSLWVRLFERSVRTSPNVVLSNHARGMAAADRLILNRPEVRAARLDDMCEGFRQGHAAPHREAQLHMADWGFSLADVPTEVYLWHGALDTSHTLAMAAHHATGIPRCRSEIAPGVGSLGYLDSMPSILARFIETQDTHGARTTPPSSTSPATADR